MNFGRGAFSSAFVNFGRGQFSFLDGNFGLERFRALRFCTDDPDTDVTFITDNDQILQLLLSFRPTGGTCFFPPDPNRYALSRLHHGKLLAHSLRWRDRMPYGARATPQSGSG